jgi:Tol biopolymer transport system component
MCIVLIALAAMASAVVGSAGARDAGEAQVPPMLVFERGGDLYRMTIDGSETVRLTTTKVEESDPAPSPDGLTIAFVRGADELWLANAQGRKQRRLLAARPKRIRYASTSDPAWSPDELSLYIARAAQGPNEICGWIYRVGTDGSGLHRVTNGVGLDGDPAPAPDGRRVALRVGECEPGLGCCFLAVVDLAGKPTKDLARLPSLPGAAFSPSWAPDEGRLVFQVTDVDIGTGGIYVANRDGSGVRRLTRKGLNAEDPTWSADGEWIAFAAWTKSASYDLYLIHPDGTGLRRITKTRTQEHSPAWLARS